MAAGPPSPERVTRLADSPARVTVAVAAVDLAALLAVVLLGRSEPVGGHDLVVFAVLAAGAIVHIEVARHVERFRETTSRGRPFIDLKSMWSFAALLLLPLGPALGIVVMTFAVWWLRVSRRPVLHRWVFSAATVVLATCAAHQVVLALGLRLIEGQGPAGLLAVCLAALVRWGVNLALVALVIALNDPGSSWRARVGSTHDAVLALGALALGVVLAVVVDAEPWLVPVLLLPLVTVHRGFLFQQLHRTASTDGKTGLATIAQWRARAGARLARAERLQRPVGILMIDIDDFKTVNDRHGHLAGDHVLRAVAGALVAELADGRHDVGDDVGRFGGEEFVAVVRGSATAETAERIRARIGGLHVPLPEADAAGSTPASGAVSAPADGAPGGTGPVLTGLTVSIGVALYPETAGDLDGLVLAADDALYAAKRAGRNRVHHAGRPALPAEPTEPPAADGGGPTAPAPRRAASA